MLRVAGPPAHLANIGTDLPKFTPTKSSRSKAVPKRSGLGDS